MRSVPLADQLASLRDHTREDLAERWTAIYGRPPPPGVRRELLCHAVAWQMQAKHLGGLSSQTRRQLSQAINRVTKRAAASEARSSIVTDDRTIDASSAGSDVAFDANKARSSSVRCEPAGRSRTGRGARLIRDWNGRTHVVDVVDGGFLYDGKIHRSLSAIARLITGARWSGPRFFGL